VLQTFEEGGYQGVAFVLDLTERNRAADTLRELQVQLAHAKPSGNDGAARWLHRARSQSADWCRTQ